MAKRRIEIMDTTLRDGEQTSGVSFSASEKLTIAKRGGKNNETLENDFDDTFNCRPSDRRTTSGNRG